MKEKFFSLSDIKKTYEPVQDHIKTRKLIFQYSVNQNDIRETALDGLDLSETELVLDLGCAYGFFTEKLAGRLKAHASITGIDVIDKANSRLFLSAVRSMGYRGEFLAGSADCIEDMAPESFDLVVASYSLYFFPHLIGHIARILRPGGVFITITHTESSLQEVTGLISDSMRALGLEVPEEFAIGRLLKVFSLENGEEQLQPYFGRIEKILFKNDLSFPREHIDDCIDYLSKKRALLFKELFEAGQRKGEEVMSVIYGTVRERAREGGAVVITKDDGVFRCYDPHPHACGRERGDL